MIKNSDMLIMANNHLSEASDPESAVSNFLSMISKSFEEKKKAVIVPCALTGLIYDILECLFLQKYNNASTNKFTPNYYFVSPNSAESLNIALTLPEWLCDQRMEKIQLGFAQCFDFKNMLDSGSLQCVQNVSGNLNHMSGFGFY